MTINRAVDPLVKAAMIECAHQRRSMESVSLKAGLAKDTLSQWVRGVREPKLQNMRAVLQVLGFNLYAIQPLGDQ